MVVVKKLANYLKLMRLHQPTGIWLLLWPCWWSLAMASYGQPPLRLLVLFGIGAVVMRGAGCIINDMADRDFDRNVARTKTRPLASGVVSMKEAFVLLALLLVIALWIALQMNRQVIFWAAGSLVLVASYPFMKRITWWPQLFLGFTFNWGALMGWVAVHSTIELPALLLYAGGIFWTLGYDTIYAHQDFKDDKQAGVKSTALRLGAHSKLWIAGFYSVACMLWAAAGIAHGQGLSYYMGLIATASLFAWQIQCTQFANPQSCLAAFKFNVWAGACIFAGIRLASLF